jgi:RAB6A-GEF complex partner protein 1
MQIRVYSRELALDNDHIMHIESLPAPIVLIAPSGEDSLLVYTYDNILYHYIIDVSNATVKLVQVGQIALHGIIRAPPRVRSLSWILPEHQIRKCIILRPQSN